MKVKSLGKKNITQIEFQKDNQYIALLVSYETPVAALIKTDKWQAYKTNVYYSVTTSKHINQWFQNIYNGDYIVVEEKDQSFFDNLMG